jgi:sarcosine oxidase subunit beta
MSSRHAVIIGAGITGLLTAIRLRKEGWNVSVAEAHHIGAGSSSRTAAGIRQQFSTTETVVGMRYSVDFYRRFCDEVGGDIRPIVQNGYLFLLKSGIEAAQKRVDMQKSAGLTDVELLTPEQTATQFPYVDPDSILGATWCSSDGFLRPGIIYGEAASACQRLGVQLYQKSPINKVRLKGNNIESVRAGNTWLEADLFIDCTNAWSPRLTAMLGGQSLPISPLKRYLWFIERSGPLTEELMSDMPMIITPSGAYCRPESRQSLMVGWAHNASSEPSFDYNDQDTIENSFSHEGMESRAYEAWEAICEVLPIVEEFAGIEATTSGYYGTTPDHNPFLCYDKFRPNLLHLVGFSGHGAMFGPFSSIAGLHLAEAGQDIDEISLLNKTVSMKAFQVDRPFLHSENMVI